MSNTLRTDAVVEAVLEEMSPVNPALRQHAEQIERELNVVKANLNLANNLLRMKGMSQGEIDHEATLIEERDTALAKLAQMEKEVQRLKENRPAESQVLLAQLETQAGVIRGHREACFQKNSELQCALAQLAQMRSHLMQAANSFRCFDSTTAYQQIEKALSSNAGNELLAEVEQLRFELALAQIPTTVDAVEREEWRQERDSLRRKVAAAEGIVKSLRDARMQLLERNDEQATSAEMRRCLEDTRKYDMGVRIPNEWFIRRDLSLHTNCGKDYVHKSEVEKAYREGYSDCADACQGSKDSRMISSQFEASRAIQVMKGEKV